MTTHRFVMHSASRIVTRNYGIRQTFRFGSDDHFTATQADALDRAERKDSDYVRLMRFDPQRNTVVRTFRRRGWMGGPAFRTMGGMPWAQPGPRA